ncbi:MAG: phosphatase PAP2 family protein [Terracidiphilus sp.]|jgi:membrane-associated phospholipid phosphatase
MLPFLRRRLDELVTVLFLLMVVVVSALHPPVFATRGGQLLARWVLSSAPVAVAALWVASRFSALARSALRFVLEWGIIVVAVVGYVSLRLLHAETVTAWLGIPSFDRAMMAADVALFGKTPYLWFSQWGLDGGLFLWIMSCFYALYPLIPPVLLAWFWFRDERSQFYLTRRALIVSYTLGYACYLLIPVSGPLSLVHSPTPSFLESTLAYSFLAGNYRFAWDCFPSLHTANPWLLVWLSRGKLPRWLMAACVIAACGITLSTIVLKVHYGIDDIAGIAWVFLIAPLARATLPRQQTS